MPALVRLRRAKVKGLIIVFTGDGKGKSTAAFGTVLRAFGQGMKSLVIQFIKGMPAEGSPQAIRRQGRWKTGESKAFEQLGVEIHSIGAGFTWTKKEKGLDKKMARKAWEFARSKISAGGHNLLVLDEMTHAISHGFIDLADVVTVLRNKPAGMHIIITGRDAPRELIDLADLVTEMKEIKHPFKLGIPAQKGIEF